MFVLAIKKRRILLHSVWRIPKKAGLIHSLLIPVPISAQTLRNSLFIL